MKFPILSYVSRICYFSSFSKNTWEHFFRLIGQDLVEEVEVRPSPSPTNPLSHRDRDSTASSVPCQQPEVLRPSFWCKRQPRRRKNIF